MTELKTLKDIREKIEVKFYDNGHADFNGSIAERQISYEWIKRETLKAEAVKWVKYYLEETIYEYSSVELLMKFHNITEEDLKEKGE